MSGQATPGGDPVVLLSRDRHVFHISMNRPAVLNALDKDLRDGLTGAIGTFEADDDALVAVISGEGGRAFSVGGDLKRMSAAAGSTALRSRLVPRFGRMHPYDDIARCPKPVIAAIDGYCLAAGLELALMCDIRVATEQSRFGLPEPRRGMMPGPGLHHLSRMIPLGEALLLHLTGGQMTAARAHQIGLVQEIAPTRREMLARVSAIADEIALCAPAVLRGIKRVVRDGRELPVMHSWLLAEATQETLARLPQAVEGPRAFAEKRAPDWESGAADDTTPDGSHEA